jgi:hypothetical protein
MSIEGLKSFFDIAALVLLFLTAAAGTGVLLTGNLINRKQSAQLRAFDAGITEAKSQLVKQQERAAKAEANIASAEQHAAEANTKAEGFRLDIAKANESSEVAKAAVAGATAEAAKATERAAEANRIAENERLARVKLEAQIAPRRLTQEQMTSIAKSLAAFRGRTATVVSYAMDPEGAVLAKQLIAAIGAAGISVTDSTASLQTFGGFSLGVHVSGNDQRFAFLLANTLSSAGGLVVAPLGSPQGGGAGMFSGTAGQESSATILVGVKPITP